MIFCWELLYDKNLIIYSVQYICFMTKEWSFHYWLFDVAIIMKAYMIIKKYNNSQYIRDTLGILKLPRAMVAFWNLKGDYYLLVLLDLKEKYTVVTATTQYSYNSVFSIARNRATSLSLLLIKKTVFYFRSGGAFDRIVKAVPVLQRTRTQYRRIRFEWNRCEGNFIDSLYFPSWLPFTIRNGIYFLSK